MEQRLATLLERYFNKSATANELAELAGYIEDESLRHQVEQALMNAWMQQSQEERMRFTNKSEDEVLASILAAGVPASIVPTKKIPLFKQYWFKISAAAVLILALGLGYLFQGGNKNVSKPIVKELQPKRTDVEPGSQKAILTLSDGRKITLDGSSDGILASQHSINIIKKDNEVIYDAGGKKLANIAPGEDIVYNTMTTPRGGQYKLKLPDGTLVWLNAQSSIKYPLKFAKERRVIVTGEAYFEVIKDPRRKFIVDAGGSVTEVLGTHFNVSSYTEDKDGIKITLLEGAVKVAAINAGSKILKPGQQADLNPSAKEILVKSADVDAATAWKNGLFQFNSDNIKTIMNKIGRWYDVDISYAGEIPGGHYSGIVSRSSKLSTVLKILEENGLRFDIQQKKLIVL